MNENNLNKRMSDMENQYNRKPIINNQEYISTGYVDLDTILNGGIPKCYITEIYGATGTGKTTIALHIIRELLKKNLLPLYIDCDRSWDNKYAVKIGVTYDDVIIVYPNDIWLELLEKLIKESLVDVIVIDTITSLSINKNRLFETLQRLSKQIKQRNISIVLLSQIRSNFKQEEKEVYSNLIKYFSTVRVYLKYISSKRLNGKILYKNIWAQTEENKLDSFSQKATMLKI